MSAAALLVTIASHIDWGADWRNASDDDLAEMRKLGFL